MESKGLKICANCLAIGQVVRFATLSELTRHVFEAHLKTYDEKKEKLHRVGLSELAQLLLSVTETKVVH